jgi:hypothetical protein
VIKYSQECKDDFKAALDGSLASFHTQSGLSASDLDAAIKRLSTVLFQIVDDSHTKADRRHIAGIMASRNAAKKLLST